MIDKESLRRALGTLERHAPAEADVLAGMRAGIARRRRRRQVASVAGVAGTASAVALGVVLVAPGRGNDQGSAPPPTTAPAPTTTKVAIQLAPPVLPFSVGWTPEGYRLDAWDTGSTGGSVQYVGTRDFQTVVVWVSAEPRDPVEGATEEPTEIAGLPGVIRRLPPDRQDTQLIWQLADGRWAMVGGRAPTVPLATLRKVAESLSPRATPMAVAMGLRDVPEGYTHASWSGGPTTGSVILCRTEIEPRPENLGADCLFVSLHTGTAPASMITKSVPTGTVEIPVDQEKVVNGVTTRASTDGEIVYAQLNPGHWVSVMSKKAGVDLVREVASNVTVN